MTEPRTPEEQTAYEDRMANLVTRLAAGQVHRIEGMVRTQGAGTRVGDLHHRLAVVGLLAAEAMVWPEPWVTAAMQRYAGLLAIDLDLDRQYVQEQLLPADPSGV